MWKRLLSSLNQGAKRLQAARALVLGKPTSPHSQATATPETPPPQRPTIVVGSPRTSTNASRPLPAVSSACPALIQHILPDDAARRRYERSIAQRDDSGLTDYEFSQDFMACRPDLAFDRLRWGGQLIFSTTQPRQVEQLIDFYRGKPEWVIEAEPQPLSEAAKVGVLERRQHFAVVRKVLLDPVSRLTARHSYDVRLVKASGAADERYATDGMVVLKRVPTLEQAIDRLTQTFQNVPPDRIEAIATKLVRKVFPVFLTREAAFLKLLQRDLPPELKSRTPRVLSMEQDDKGLLRAMSLRWLRMGGTGISQRAFAMQYAELLRALHERVGILHLDLRLDNIVVTDEGVGMVDFGTSVRLNETFELPGMTGTLLREMLQSSQVTADLERHRRKNRVTSGLFNGLPYPPTAAFDLFAMATSITRPHDHPDLKGLVRFNPTGDQAKQISLLRRDILTPPDPANPIYRTVHDVCLAMGVEADRPDPAAGSGKLKPVIIEGPNVPRLGRASPIVE